jgi:adenine-specific DNA-methyltransferase
LNTVFGEENLLAHIVWQKRYVSNVTARWISDMHDHILVYARNKEEVEVNRLPRTEEQLEAYKRVGQGLADYDLVTRWLRKSVTRL